MKKQAFTLIELLTVTFILAIIAGSIIVSFSGAEDYSRNNLQTFEISEIQKALMKFKSDTGHYPKTGALEYSNLQVNVTSQKFNTKSNLTQLFKKPRRISDTNDDETTWYWTWNIDSKRGWRGPYLNIMNTSVIYDDPGEDKEESYLELIEQGLLDEAETDYYILKGKFGKNISYNPSELSLSYSALNDNKELETKKVYLPK